MKESVRILSFFCIDVSESTGNQLRLDCPWCLKPNHLYMNADSMLWDCKRCGRKGNINQFINQLVDHWYSQTDDSSFSTLSSLHRRHSIRVDTLKSNFLFIHPSTGVWYIPIFSLAPAAGCNYRTSSNAVQPSFRLSSSISSIKRWHPSITRSKLMSMPGRPQALYFPFLSLAEKPPILDECDYAFICEGEWDGLALSSAASFNSSEFFRLMTSRLEKPYKKDSKFIIVSSPGASSFKQEWAGLFHGKHVVILFDNDSAGRDGVTRICKILHRHAASVSYVSWPDEMPSGFDVSDFLSSDRPLSSAKLKSKLSSLGKLIHPATATHTTRTDKGSLSSSPLPPDSASTCSSHPHSHAVDFQSILKAWEGSPPSIHRLIETFDSHLYLDDFMRDAIRIMMAVAVSSRSSGDPLWMFIVGPPGCGKTALLKSMSGSESCVFISSLTPRTLISGSPLQDEDPSLLPKLQGRTLVLKDYTEIICMPYSAQEEVYGVLRGAYDGRAEKVFGNGIRRVYYDCWFNILAGVTPIIHSHTRATLGERFLKYELLSSDHDSEKHIIAAINQANSPSYEHTERILQSATASFLSQSFPTPPAVHETILKRIVCLSQLVAYLRAGVDRTYGGELAYRPRVEVGTRLAKQLTKLLRFLASIHHYSTSREIIESSPSIYSIVERVALNTAAGWSLDLIQPLFQYHSKGGLTRRDLCDLSKTAESTAARRLNDMLELGIVERKASSQNRRGAPVFFYRLSEHIYDLYLKAFLK